MSREVLARALNTILLFVCFVVAFGFVNLMAKFFPAYVGVAAFWFVLTISVFMMSILLHSFKNHKTSLVVTISTLTVFTAVAFVIAVDKPKAVVYDTEVMVSMTLIACALAALPFIVKQQVLCFSENHARRDSIFFGASVMWLSTLFADLMFLIKWSVQGILLERLRYMTLGGAGFNDVLFFYGAVAFLTITLFHLITRSLNV